MGQLKDLLDKKAKDELTDEEQKQLDALLEKADTEVEVEGGDKVTVTEQDEEKAIEEAAEKLASAVQEKNKERDARMDKILTALEDKPVISVTKEARFIDDP